MELAWSVDREVPGRLGEVLRAILESDGDRKLDVVRRPAALQEVLAQLEQLCERNPGKIAADKHILAEAISECRQVTRAAEASAPPPSGLRLPACDDEDLEAWASEGSGARKVTPGTPVWDTLVRQLAQRRDLIRRAFALWPGSDREAPELPADWRRTLSACCGAGADLACDLVEDAVPEPGDRPRLEPATVVATSTKVPTGPSRRLWFMLVREAVEAGDLSWPDWAAPLARKLDAIKARLDELHVYEGEAAEALAVARQELAEIDPDEAEVWIRQATEMHEAATGSSLHATSWRWPSTGSGSGSDQPCGRWWRGRMRWTRSCAQASGPRSSGWSHDERPACLWTLSLPTWRLWFALHRRRRWSASTAGGSLWSWPVSRRRGRWPTAWAWPASR